jgi:hypothetical protein
MEGIFGFLGVVKGLALNDMFIKDGYNVTLDQKKLKYFIISERKSHEVGSYTNGGKASRLETIVVAINAQTGGATELLRNMGSEPPKTTNYDWGKSGDSWSDEDIFENLRSKI